MSYQRLYSFFPILFLILFLSFPQLSEAQVVRSTGNATEASTQLVYYYSQDNVDSGNNPDTIIQVTNVNDTTGVWIHVQLFRSYDADDDRVTGTDKIICEERNFVDFLTPNDTHQYDLDEDNFWKNMGETEADEGEETSLVDTDEGVGFIIITPVVSESDLTAIAFQNLIGISLNDDNPEFVVNAMGRDAVDFATGEVLDDGTPLDGVTNGLVLLQPSELVFLFGTDDATPEDNEVDVVGIAFQDIYGPPGLLGYQVVQADVTWTSFIFDYKEDPTSCGNMAVNCFLTVGLNDTLTQNIEELNPAFISDDTAEDDQLLCAGTSTPEYPEGPPDNFSEPEFFGWTRIFVSGVGDFENHLGIFINEDVDSARWMNTNE